ncbi:hypothetical protein FQA39_LY14568 [Lamprigera yunnana]|nr:hypothetical protein FQA39_LY14568 [Lamprigera yunnana]
MDVSFTNVLEGARQYFQGLPTATCATTNPSYVSGGEQSNPYTEHHQDRAPTSSHWPPPHLERSQQRETQQRPPSHHSETPRPSSHNQNVQEHIRSSSSYHVQNSHQDQSNRASRIPEMATPSTYHHQIQQSQNQQQNYNNYQQNRSYYPVPSQTQQQPQYYHQAYQTTSSQAYVQSQSQEVSYMHQSYPPHSQTSFGDNNYPTSKTHSSHDGNALKENQTNLTTPQNQQTSQPYRTTHNLPPIAALSSLNYHSSRSNREAIRLGNINKSRASAASYQYQPTVTYSNNYKSTANNVTTTSSAVSINCQTQPSYINQGSPKTYQTTKPNQQAPIATPVLKQKRESPLDLSVKTVRTSADSTLDDSDSNLNDQKRLTKYYQSGRPITNSLQGPLPSYSTCDAYSNAAYHRNLPTKSTTSSTSGVPKVDFLPNFNVSALSQTPSSKIDNRRSVVQNSCDNASPRQYYDRKNTYQSGTPQHNTTNVIRQSVVQTQSNSQHVFSNTLLQQSSKKSSTGLPRIDFLPPSHKASTMYAVPSGEAQRKRTLEQVPPVVPNKIQKVDVWRQTIDQQIEQRLSSYAKSRQQQEQIQKQLPNKQLVNGNCNSTPNSERKDAYPPYHRQYSSVQSPQSYSNNTGHYGLVQSGHSQTYVPNPVPHQYPGYINHAPQQHQPHQQQVSYTQHSLPRTSSNPSLAVVGANRGVLGGAADRRVLSLLRNSLEIKGAKEAQRKLEKEQSKPLESQLLHPRSEIQQPSTDVMAPLQPKPGVVGRHNMSPFAATSLYEQNSNTPPTYKFHLPKAIDSIKFDTEISKDNKMTNKGVDVAMANSNTDLDGLTAILAARIRTKAELKQVGTMHNLYASTTENMIRSSSENQIFRQATEPSNGNSPPKLTRERVSYLPRRKLFNRTDDEINGAQINNVPLRDKSGLRSSSETSVFDFPDSDSDTEMPVLERQSLLEMRRDRKVLSKPVVNEVQETPDLGSLDISFDDACDKFVAQLKAGVGKKRGRRKKMVEADVLAKLETVVTREKPNDDTAIEPKIEVKSESDSDSDTPLSKCKSQSKENDLNDMDEITNTIKKDVNEKIEIVTDSGSESDTDEIKLAPSKDTLKEQPKRDKTPVKTGNGKSAFGDGTDFYPGWEEEVYNYKRSLRMPAALIHVTRPPQWHRLSTSLPDLDPCPNSPCPSENQDSKAKLRVESIDSDLDSNSNFSFSLAKNNYDSEEGSSSIKSISNLTSAKPKYSNSILDRLLERCGARKRRRAKKKSEDNIPKIIQKSEKDVQLLPTPGLEVETVISKKIGPIIKEESALLGFRKKTVDNFKDTFINSSNNILGVNEEFKAVVMKSRTRLETRVLKQKATIKEVFGEDRPASAPPVTCIDNIEEIECKSEINVSFSSENTTTLDSPDLRISAMENTKEALKNKLLNRGRKGCSNLLKSLTTRKLISEYVDEDLIKCERDSKSETPSIDGDDYTPTRRRIKNIRRKFSSGFDYIRKKKKQVKKDNLDSESTGKPKRKGLLSKATPESEQDIQKEIKMWVMNKGIGETHLHRASRLGYTDITAYCLEKMDVFPSPKDNAGYTPLHEACARGHLNIAKLLLLYGANVSESAQGGIRIHIGW